MHIAEKTEPNRTTKLELLNDGHLMLWIIYPERPDKDIGWPLKCPELAALIKAHGLKVLD